MQEDRELSCEKAVMGGMTTQKRRRLTAALIGGMMFLACTFALHGSMLTYVIEHYQLTDSLQGSPSAAGSAGGFIALISILLWGGKIPKMTLLKWSVGVCALFLCLLPMGSEFTLFVICWGIIGIGLGYMDALLSSCMADLYQGSAVKKMMCILHLTYGIGYMASPIIYSRLTLSFIENAIQWNMLYPCVGLFGLFLLLYILFAARSEKNKESAGVTAENTFSLKRFSALLRVQNGLLVKMIAAMLFHGIFQSGMSTWINHYVEKTLGAEFGVIALSCLFFGVMLSRLIMSFLKISPERYVGIGGFAAFGVILAALLWGNAAVVCIACGVSGLIFGAMFPCILAVISNVAPGSTLLVTTLLMLSFYLGQVIGPAMVGALESAYDLHVGIGVCSGFIALTSLCCLGKNCVKRT
ncbi:MAG: MFS transporter [Lachnospiraceae bacterium]|nr:MFS transporter [Lachnospiraceae bacterium]